MSMGAPRRLFFACYRAQARISGFYTSSWTGVNPDSSPRDAHVILIENGRIAALKDPIS